ncbi:MAG: SURF1 family protein [Propionicimonas sp.]|nr:SURF1 family protein [Propionicimonas sp.]
MPVRARQALVGVAGFAIALVMLWLGLWQMQVFEAKENSSAEARAALPAVPLLENVDTDGGTGDVYGRRVSTSGTYLPAQQVLVTDETAAVRVLTALQLPDGRVLPVVRGTLATGGQPPLPPAGEVEVVGVFLPSEPAADSPTGSVRLPALAQEWGQQLLPGFVTLDASGARAQGLEPAAVELLTGEGSLQNYGYALQWWVFAGFAAFMTMRFVRAIGRQGTLGSTEELTDLQRGPERPPGP